MTPMTCRFSLCALLWMCAAACGSRSNVLDSSAVGAGAEGGGASAVVAGRAGGAGAGSLAGGAAGGAGDQARPCQTASDCGPPNPCTTIVCTGTCNVQNTLKGTLVSVDEPANCQATFCDGFGRTVPGLELDNVPVPTNPCLVGTCGVNGTPGLANVPAGVACSSNGGKRCDGAGGCVECLVAADCQSDEVCSAHRCVSAAPCTSCLAPSCSDKQKNGSETGVDCGGSCARCADSLSCTTDQDCASDACDPLRLICLPATCINQKQDGLETDVDCGGGVCAGCYILKTCVTGADCATQRCEPTRHVCFGNSCADRVQDGSETDVDCGGGICNACASGKKCLGDFDCDGGCNVSSRRCN